MRAAAPCASPSRMRALSGARALALVLVVGSGCSAIVAAPPGPLRCDPGAVGACPEGDSCLCVAEGDCTCVPCDPSPEQCNGLDEDCDGSLDEGLGLDRDGDSVQGCSAGMTADCDDANPLVFPGNPEVCNGYDDDCDLGTVETGSCGAGLFCGPALDGTIRCVDPANCNDLACRPAEVCRDGTCTTEVGDDCNTTPSLCTAAQICDRASGRCVDVTVDGMPCVLDSECESGRCYPRDALGLLDTGGVCSRACCTNANCGNGQYCAAPGTGARGCVLGMETPPTACARPGDCGGTECRHDDTSLTFVCGDSTGGVIGGEPCSAHEECASNLCGSGYCSDPCGSVLDCPATPWWASGRGCRYVSYRNATSAGVRHVTVCQYSARLVEARIPDAGQGAPCTAHEACRDGFCNFATSTCADACCDDDQCPAGNVCAPVRNGARWEMRCRAG